MARQVFRSLFGHNASASLRLANNCGRLLADDRLFLRSAQNLIVGDGVLSDVHQELPAGCIPRSACAQCIGVQNQVNCTGNFNGLTSRIVATSYFADSSQKAGNATAQITNNDKEEQRLRHEGFLSKALRLSYTLPPHPPCQSQKVCRSIEQIGFTCT